MNANISKDFINNHKDKILELIEIYQWIEIYFISILLFPDISPSDRGNEKILKDLNKKLNSKTMGMIIHKYNQKYPNDEYKIKDLLIIVKDQRNAFMHSFFISISFMKVEDIELNGELILKSNYDNAIKLFEKIQLLSKAMLVQA